MKVALCLFGIVGGSGGKDGLGAAIDPSIAYEHYLRNILAGNTVDVYFHTWSVNSEVDLVKMYQPKDYIVEPQKIFSTDPIEQRIHSRWYSTQQSVNVIHRNGHFGEYDMIMSSRLDVAFFSKVDLAGYSPENFYASHWNDVGNKENYSPDKGLLDLWFFGGTSIMVSFAQLYNRVREYNMSPHFSSRQHAEKIGAKIKYTMYRGEDFEMVRRAILKCKA